MIPLLICSGNKFFNHTIYVLDLRCIKILISSFISFSHTYASIGSYQVVVNCSNGVNSQTVTTTADVQEPITALGLVRSGANKNTNFYLEVQVSTGSNITFTVSFDNANLSMWL